MNRRRYITRLDYDRTHAWWVRFQRGPADARRTTGKMFSDLKWGGKRRALAAAIAWRDENLPLHPPLPKGSKGSGRKPEPVGYSSVSTFERTVRHPNGRIRVTPVLLAKFKKSKRQFVSLQLSIAKWGKEPARRKIDRWLREQRAKLGAKNLAR